MFISFLFDFRHVREPESDSPSPRTSREEHVLSIHEGTVHLTEAVPRGVSDKAQCVFCKGPLEKDHIYDDDKPDICDICWNED